MIGGERRSHSPRRHHHHHDEARGFGAVVAVRVRGVGDEVERVARPDRVICSVGGDDDQLPASTCMISRVRGA